jgi:S1-C subfamily serine protease
MNYIDVIIVAMLGLTVFRGFELGFVRQLLSTLGFFLGLWIGVLLEPYTIKLVRSQDAQSIVALITTLGGAFLFLSVGEYAGIKLKKRLTIKHVDTADNALGTGIALVSVLVAVWLSAAIVQSMQLPGLQADLERSRIVSWLNDHGPPAPTIIAGIGKLIDPNGFPTVFSGREPVPPSDVPLPELGDLEAVVKADAASVVKIEGQGCGGVVDGSGFVVADSIVVTNAHVVAGIKKPYVVDSQGTKLASANWFDPDLDVAVLRTSKLAGKPLKLNATEVPQGTPAAVLGYPGGGGFSAKPAAILNLFSATGRNIYDRGAVEREIYEVRAEIRPGNSGGPLIAKDGSVIGVVFAESTAYDTVGYALRTGAVSDDIAKARAQNRTVSTGSCAEQ